MKILALYDIHGNVEALDAVLADPRAAGADAVVVGGDTAPGAYAREALDRLEALGLPTRWVRGNGEREVAAAAAGTAPDPGPDGDVALHTAALTATALGPERARALGAHPTTVELDGVLFCHATPRSDEELLTRISTPERWAAALVDVAEPLVVCGHTHQQDDRAVGATRVVNAGSVGMPYEGDGAARWALIVDGEPTLLTTEYDATGAGRRILDEAGWPDAPSIGASLTDPVAAIEVTTLFEERANAAS